MTQAFPASMPFLQNNYAPVMGETVAHDLIVHGDMPRDLNGTLYRNGPNPMYPPLGKNHHWFLGEGMIHAITVEDGRVSYRNRWIETDQYKLHRELGRRVIDVGFGAPREAGYETLKQNVANTNIVWHGNKLMALDEGNSPFELDPVTLEARGPWTFDGAYTMPMTAHPKMDAKTGEMFFFAYQADQPASRNLSYVIVDRDGKVTRSELIEAPYCAMVHDFIVTDTHVIFPLFPATIDIDRIMKGGPVIAWDEALPSYVGIMERYAPVETIRWFEGEPCYVYHPMNAYTVKDEKGTRIIADMAKYDRVPLMPDVDGTRAPKQPEGELGGNLVRWTFDLDGNTNGWTESLLSETRGEFPRLDERFAGYDYRHGYFASEQRVGEVGSSSDTVVHIDHKTGAEKQWQTDVGQYLLEPVFVPRHETAEEGDGYLLTVLYDKSRNLSDFIVFDCDDISKGPVARAELPNRVPFGFHGNWRSF